MELPPTTGNTSALLIVCGLILLSATSQTYSLVHNSVSFNTTNRSQIRCTTVVAGTTYISNVLTITKKSMMELQDRIARPWLLYQRSATSPANPQTQLYGHLQQVLKR